MSLNWRNLSAQNEANSMIKIIGNPSSDDESTYGLLTWNQQTLGSITIYGTKSCLYSVSISDSNPTVVTVSIPYGKNDQNTLNTIYNISNYIPCYYISADQTNNIPAQLAANWSTFLGAINILAGSLGLIANNTTVTAKTLSTLLTANPTNSMKLLCPSTSERFSVFRKSEKLSYAPTFTPPTTTAVSSDPANQRYVDLLKDYTFKPTDPRFVNNTAQIFFRAESDSQDPIPYMGTTDQMKPFPKVTNYLNSYGILKRHGLNSKS